ncbi:MAG: hypothetical protein E7268_09045 [Lachnospiraceae bacterium]|nr:hypothetical protein [Lachnospiraceae bacterium]
MKKLKRGMVSIMLAAAMLFTCFATPKSAQAAGQQTKQYVCDGFNVEFTVTDEYDNVFQADMTITNTGTEVMRDWAFSCDFMHKITNIWNARVLRTQDEFCVIGNYDWNQNLAPGESATFGLVAEKTADGEIIFPDAFALVMKEVVVDTADYSVEFIVFSDWGAANDGMFVVRNLTGRTIHNWELTFAYDREITKISNSAILSYENGLYSLRNAGYNADLEPYGATYLNFNAGQGNGTEKAVIYEMTEIAYDTVQHPFVFSGTVTESLYGGPAAGATVEVLQNGVPVQTVTTDANGIYRISLYKGNYDLRVSKDFYYPVETTFVSSRYATAPNVELSPMAYALNGVVTDAVSGDVLSGVVVTVKDGETVVAEAVTDENGAYSANLYHKEYTLAYAAEDYVGTTVSVIGGEQATADVALDRVVYELTGVVTDAVSGDVLSGVVVTVKDGETVVAEAVTDENGAYSANLYHKEYTLAYAAEDYVGTTVSVIGGEQATADVALDRVVYELTGVVTDAVSGDVLSGVVVTVKDGENVVAEAVTDENGAYSANLYHKEYTLAFAAEDYVGKTVSVIGGEQATADVALDRVVYELTGVVTDAVSGDVLSGVVVTVKDGETVVAEAVTDENGAYSANLYHKEYTLAYAAEDYVGTTVSVIGREQATADVALDRVVYTETGVVVDAETGDVLAGVVVTLTQNGEVFAETVTDENGAYSLEFYKGAYTVSFEKEGYEEKEVSRDGMGSLVVEKEELCPEIYDVYGEVKNAVNGQKLEGVLVKVYEGSFDSLDVIPVEVQPVATLETDANGSYSVRLPKGAYTLVFEKEGFITGLLKTESVKNGDAQTTALSPILEDNEYRIVLTWAAAPKDLDSHLDIYENGTRKYHVYYGSTKVREDGEVIAKLDVDDMNGYGPETVTVTVFADKDRTYTYYIHCWSSTPAGSPQFYDSEAVVNVYRGDELVKTYEIPEDQTDRYWYVFDIIDGEIVDR